jgi:hypothetical protein
VDVYDQVRRVWLRGPAMSEKRDELGLVLGFDRRIYAIGGYSHTCLCSCERLDMIAGRWEPIPPMVVARRALAVVSLPDGVYAIGGFNGISYLNTVERYDDLTNTWRTMTPLLYPRCTLTALVTPDNQYIYVFGGFDHEPLDEVEKYIIHHYIY